MRTTSIHALPIANAYIATAIAISIHITHSLAHSAHADVPTHRSALHRFSGCSCRKDSYKTYNTVKIYLIFKLMTRTTSFTISNGYCALGIHAYLSFCMYNVYIYVYHFNRQHSEISSNTASHIIGSQKSRSVLCFIVLYKIGKWLNTYCVWGFCATGIPIQIEWNRVEHARERKFESELLPNVFFFHWKRPYQCPCPWNELIGIVKICMHICVRLLHFTHHTQLNSSLSNWIASIARSPATELFSFATKPIACVCVCMI